MDHMISISDYNKNSVTAKEYTMVTHHCNCIYCPVVENQHDNTIPTIRDGAKYIWKCLSTSALKFVKYKYKYKYSS